MKRLFFLILIITLPLIVWFQYQQYIRFHPPSDYTYTVSEEIDTNYHNPEVVKAYYLAAEECGQYAKFCWAEHGVDVLTDSPTDPESKTCVRNYLQMQAHARFLEQKLLQSAKWKESGLSQEEIIAKENGVEPSFVESYNSLVDNTVLLEEDMRGPLAYEVQRLLIDNGYQIPLDGIYRQETMDAVKAYQQSQNLYPSGNVDKRTLISLMQTSNP